MQKVLVLLEESRLSVAEDRAPLEEGRTSLAEGLTPLEESRALLAEGLVPLEEERASLAKGLARLQENRASPAEGITLLEEGTTSSRGEESHPREVCRQAVKVCDVSRHHDRVAQGRLGPPLEESEIFFPEITRLDPVKGEGRRGGTPTQWGVGAARRPPSERRK